MSVKKTTLRTVINEVTKEKLTKLEKRNLNLKSHFAPILEKFQNPEYKSSLKYLKEIHTALTSGHVDNPIPDITEDLSTFLNWIQEDDPIAPMYFGSCRLVENWIGTLVQLIENKIEKCEYSRLYANVMSQYWDDNPEDEGDDDPDNESCEPKSQSESEAPATKTETIKEFSRLVFAESTEFDKDAFEDFLNTKLFDDTDPTQKSILNEARAKVSGFSVNGISTSTLQTCIDGLLKANFLGLDKVKTLKELRENSAALQEVATLLDNRLENFHKWTWPEPVFVDFRRNLAGRYRAHMEEDIITAIILHYLGAQWSITMKSVFKSIYNSSMWKQGSEMVGKARYTEDSIEGYRRKFHSSSFLSVLPNKLEDLTVTGAGYDDESDSDDSDNDGAYRYRQRLRHQKEEKTLTPMEIKKKLLHLMCNEVHLNYVLRPEKPLTVVQTDVQWFGPSIVHEAIFSIMRFFGATEEWVDFFRKFLEAPMRVGSPKAPVQVRKRGAPISHTFTALFGEMLLFIMDLYVNQVSGVNIYRIHDDFWFWSPNPESVAKAWNAMQTYTKLTDLKLNEEKSASVICTSDAGPDIILPGPEPLPQRKVKWGFVVLHSDGEYRISKDLLEPHVKEMRDYLQKSGTVMNWIHGHNKYIRFFIRNFVEPTRTLQKQHVIQMLEALNWILVQVHEETEGDTVAALKLKFSQVLCNKDIIDSWAHSPSNVGGLNLYNPFLTLVPLLDAYKKDEERTISAIYGHEEGKKLIQAGDVLKRFEKLTKAEEMEWKEHLDESLERRKSRDKQYYTEVDNTVTDDELRGNREYYPHYMDKEEIHWSKRARYARRTDYKTWRERIREERASTWRNHYVQLLTEIGVKGSKYNTWREWLYDEQSYSKLGQDETEFVDTTLVPLSLISSLQQSRVHKN